MSPKVSIIIPCYNAEPWIEKCILSALDQAYPNIEVIFVDNESTDNSAAIAKKVQEQRPELIISSAPNLYRYSWEEPVSEGLKLFTGDYITILGADDYILPSYIAYVMKYITGVPLEVLAFQSPIRGVKGDTETYIGEIGHFYKNMSEFKKLLFEKCPVTTPSVVYSRKLYERDLLKWDSQYLGACDYNLYFHLADSGVFIFPCDRFLGYQYRWHRDQATWGMQREGINYDETIRETWRKKWTPA